MKNKTSFPENVWINYLVILCFTDNTIMDAIVLRNQIIRDFI